MDEMLRMLRMLKVCGDNRYTPEELQGQFESCKLFVAPSTQKAKAALAIVCPEQASLLSQTIMLMDRGE